jgi:hypothetical protein
MYCTVNYRKLVSSVVVPHHFYAAPALGKIFDAAPAPTQLIGKPTF